MKVSSLTAGFVGGVLGLVLALASCGPAKASCSAASCSGCCTDLGTCVGGNTTLTCGAAGNGCKACSAGEACNSGKCTASGTGGGTASTGGGTASTGGGAASTGGGTASTGGGSGTGGGASTTCSSTMTIAAITANGLGPDQGDYFDDTSNPGFSEEDAFVLAPGSTATSANVLWASWYRATGQFPPTPYTAMLSPGAFLTCSNCIIYSTGCDAMLNCTEDYLAQTGNMSVTTSTTNPNMGTFAGTLSNLHFVQWHIPTQQNMTDGPINNPKCIDVTAASFNATWPFDAGM